MTNVKQSMLITISALLLFAAFLIPATADADDDGYHVLARYKLTGHGKTGNVRVDSEARRLYVARGDRVDVLNADTGASIGMVRANGSNGTVLAPDFKHGFISNGTVASVTIFDPVTLKVVKTIQLTAQNHNAMEYDPDVKRVFVAAPGRVTAIDASSGEVVGSVPLEGRLGHLISNDYGRLFVAAEDSNVIHVVDTAALKFLGDMGLMKETAISERVRTLFQVQAFNVFNRVNFQPPQSTQQQIFNASGNLLSTAGQLTLTATSSRQLQFSLKVLL